MENKVCEKCKSPIIVEDGKFVCITCGTIYGEVKVTTPATQKDYSDFFKKIIFEEFRKINELVSEKVVIKTAPVGERSKRSYYCPYGTNFIVAALSNGQYFSKFNPCLGIFANYNGQCAAENWVGVTRIFATKEFSVGITDDGMLQPTLCEVDSFFKEIDNDLRMRQIVYVYDQGKQFIGVSIDGEIIIRNPFGILGLREDDEEEFKICTNFLKKIKNWPPIKRAYMFGMGCGMLVGITEQDKVVCASTDTEKDPLCAALKSLKEVDSITYDFVDDTTKIHILQKNGSVTLLSFEETYGKESKPTKNKLKISDVVQIKDIDIAKLNGYGEILDSNSELLYLKSNGDMICKNKILAKNVIAIVDNGYICVDGTVYERKISTDTEYVPIEGLKLFDAIETLYEEWENTTNAYKNFLSENQEKLSVLKQEVHMLNEEAKEIENQLSNLGLFQGKRKKALRQELTAINEKKSSILREIEEIPDGTPKWKRPLKTEQNVTGGYYSIGELSAMVDRSIAGGQSKNKSVIGSAVTGGIIAGPVGAVVGAVYAADKNNRKK